MIEILEDIMKSTISVLGFTLGLMVVGPAYASVTCENLIETKNTSDQRVVSRTLLTVVEVNGEAKEGIRLGNNSKLQSEALLTCQNAILNSGCEATSVEEIRSRKEFDGLGNGKIIGIPSGRVFATAQIKSRVFKTLDACQETVAVSALKELKHNSDLVALEAAARANSQGRFPPR
jgi:hypothetical protein